MKMYKSYSGYPSGLKERSFERVMKEDPTYALKHAVKGMLPKNRLGKRMITHLLLYAGDQHPHQAQMPKPLPAGQVGAGTKKTSLPANRDAKK